ncbi:MAG TPA: hypothetical protein VH083_26625 [Myxococcales bacterium]|nr:hypothetical protein [Myxococcales bacterium]
MTRVLLFIALLGLASRPARACKCRQESDDLQANLKTARENAVAIYRARVDAADDSSRAWVDVLEVFKGDVKSGSHLELPAGGGGDCSINFRIGLEYLMYATGSGPTSVGLCSRTRAIKPADLELTWLRERVLPPAPVALQRETVSCEPCDILAVGGRLIAGPGARPRPFDWPPSARGALESGRPFFTNADSSDPAQRAMAGISFGGKAFELTDTAVDAACARRVQLRWCARVEVTSAPGSYPSFACVGPGEPELQCDQSTSRRAHWEPLEALQPGSCRWLPLDEPRCLLEAGQPLPAKAPQTPVLACRAAARNKRYLCKVEPAVHPTEAFAGAAAPGR